VGAGCEGETTEFDDEEDAGGDTDACADDEESEGDDSGDTWGRCETGWRLMSFLRQSGHKWGEEELALHLKARVESPQSTIVCTETLQYFF
jgi:hypothetical protein